MTLYDKLKEARAEYDKAKRKVNRLHDLLDDALIELNDLKIAMDEIEAQLTEDEDWN